mgnify:CR=1 FL=1
MLVRILFAVTVLLSLKDGVIEEYEIGLIMMGAFCMLFVSPGSDHENESSQ